MKPCPRSPRSPPPEEWATPSERSDADRARYFRLWFAAWFVMLLAAVAFNYRVDPYGLYHDYGEGDWKPHAPTQGALVKTYRVMEADARTLVLGNSRAEVGFDPDDPAWPLALRPVYNLAVPGSSMRTVRRLFEHALLAHPPEAVLLGVDFMNFLLPPDARGHDFPEVSRMLSSGDAPRRWLAWLRDGATTLASLDALIHSLDTLRVRGQPGVAHLTRAGFNPLRDYEASVGRDGYYPLFRQKDLENLHGLRQWPANLYARGTKTSHAFEDVRAMLEQARSRNMRVWIVIYPYHAHLLESIRMTGLWPLFEEWKRALTRLVAAEGGHGAVLWDFSGHHVYALEPAPGPGDRHAGMRWYWESGHFKKELGHQILSRLFGAATAAPGVILTPANIESHLDRLRQASMTYRRHLPDQVRDLERLVR